MTNKTGISSSGYGPIRTMDGERCRVRYEGLDHWKGSPKKLDQWSLWHDRGDDQWVLDCRICLLEGSTLADAEKSLFGFDLSLEDQWRLDSQVCLPEGSSLEQILEKISKHANTTNQP